LLHLPEFGEVTVELTLKRDGAIVNVIVLKTQSVKNRIFLEKTLPTLRLPAFENAYLGKEMHTFIVNFENTLQ
jgi:colicin import membrane protein